MNSLSIIFIVATYPATYGHTSVINNLCQGLTKLGHRTAIGAFTFKKDPPKDVEKVQLSRFELLRSGVKSLDYDIIHPHQAQVLYFLLAKKPDKPVIVHYHAASNMIQKLNLKFSMALFKNKISKFISVSKKASNHLKEWAGECDDIVVYNGVDTKFFNPNLDGPYRKGEPQLLFVSVLRKYKKTIELVNAIPELSKKYPKVHLQIVGDGEEFETLNDIIKQKGLEERVEMTGRIDDDELKLRYASSDLYISASTNEHCPVPTFEAMACGKPLVLSELESHNEIIAASKAGLTFSFSDVKDLCQKVEQVYENRVEYGNGAKNFIVNHSLEEFCKRVEEIYNKVLNQ